MHDTVLVTTQSVGSDRIRELVGAHAPDLLRFFLRRVAEPEDAADLLGDTLLVVWRRRDDVPRDALEARLWMFGVARRTLSTARRGDRRRSLLGERLIETAQPAVGPVEPDERVEEVAALVAQLPDVDREIIRLVHSDGFSLAEAATILRMRATTVRSRYARARARLRTELG